MSEIIGFLFLLATGTIIAVLFLIGVDRGMHRDQEREKKR